MSLPDYMVLCRGGDLTDHVEVTTQDHLAKLNGSADYRRDPNEMTRCALLLAYSRLTALTGEVTGRSLIDCEKSDNRLMEIAGITLISAAIATAMSALSVTHPVVTASAPPASPWPNVILYTGLFFWGAFGSGLYLLKSLYDRVADGSFDTRLLQGHRTRILLGASLAAVMPRLFNLGADGVNVDAVAVAILTGLGVKVIYGAIENLIDALADRFNLGSVSQAQPASASAVAAALAPPLAAAGTGSAAPSGIPSPGNSSAPAPQSALGEAQRLLAGLGKYSGPMDGQLNATMIAAVRDFAGNRLSEAQVRALSPAVLLRWLRAGGLPNNWQDQMADPSRANVAVSLPPAEIAANREAFQLLQARGWAKAEVDVSDPVAIARSVDSSISELVRVFPAMNGLSFTQLLNLLRSDADQNYRKSA
jgi:hypothetical protein